MNYNRNFNRSETITGRTNTSHFNRPQLYEIHPISIKMIQKGNPWVTLDKYSEQFHPNEKFIVASNRRKPFALLLHDPRHSTVRARLWSKEGNFGKQIKNFKNDFIARVKEAFKQRKDQKILDKRNNLYLLFGEADRVPGLFIQLLNDQILIQSYTHFWDRYQDIILQTVMNQMKQVFGVEVFKDQIWMQNRADSNEFKAPAKGLDPNLSFKRFEINEFGCKYNVSIGEFYDNGIYTDMAAVREKLEKTFKSSKKVLNLYSYTGAFSVYAMKNGATKVTSVDLSETYMELLESNIKLNEDMSIGNHTSMISSVSDALNELKDKETFDLIICDPPSSSSNGTKRTNALKEYEKMLPKMYHLLEDGGQMVLFLNTHKVSKRKFSEKIDKITADKKLNLKNVKFLSLNSDCPSMPRFAEGSYLKGFILKKAAQKDDTSKKPE
ncbi:MAG: class I SAM-dependent methyltransferase [Bacteriovoracaceae bacterium]|jgi:23S rRNA (cytosine1962-C5)-methyltransferase|nr:class I SAM-dependent methyltransferase [Bacteriovoracaceae bacterium]